LGATHRFTRREATSFDDPSVCPGVASDRALFECRARCTFHARALYHDPVRDGKRRCPHRSMWKCQLGAGTINIVVLGR
ncbi:conserved hypothetical protein, partial [Ricinus communis]